MLERNQHIDVWRSLFSILNTANTNPFTSRLQSIDLNKLNPFSSALVPSSLFWRPITILHWKSHGPASLQIKGHNIEPVTYFNYLGCKVTKNASCATVIITRIALAESAFGKLYTILKNCSTNLKTRRSILFLALLSPGFH